MGVGRTSWRVGETDLHIVISTVIARLHEDVSEDEENGAALGDGNSPVALSVVVVVEWIIRRVDITRWSSQIRTTTYARCSVYE